MCLGTARSRLRRRRFELELGDIDILRSTSTLLFESFAIGEFGESPRTGPGSLSIVEQNMMATIVMVGSQK